MGEFVSDAWHHIQGELFPFLAEEVGPLGETHRRFVAVLDLAPAERHVLYDHRGVGHPPADRNALARAFVAKAVWDLPTTAALIDRLRYDPTLRRLCGWCRVSQVPSASALSRAFAWFAETRLPERVHGALVRAAYDGSVVGHISRDSTAIVGRERPAPKPKPAAAPDAAAPGTGRRAGTHWRPRSPASEPRRTRRGVSSADRACKCTKKGTYHE